MGANHELFAAGAAGLLSHNLVFIHGEWHLQATRILKFYCLLFAIVLLLETRYNGLPFIQAVTASSRIFVVYVFSIFASMSIYRSLFHKLRRFPGPFFARFSKLWHLFHCLGSKNYMLLEKLHDQYGDFVRTGRSCVVTVIENP